MKLATGSLKMTYYYQVLAVSCLGGRPVCCPTTRSGLGGREGCRRALHRSARCRACRVGLRLVGGESKRPGSQGPLPGIACPATDASQPSRRYHSTLLRLASLQYIFHRGSRYSFDRLTALQVVAETAQTSRPLPLDCLSHFINACGWHDGEPWPGWPRTT